MKSKLYHDLSVLIVEDDLNARVEVIDVLELYFGFVYSAKDGCEGLELIKKFHPDVIVTDISMPCMNGLEMMIETKNSTKSSNFIFTTAYSDPKYLLDAINNQAFAYLVKPIKFDILLEKIAEMLIFNQLPENDAVQNLHTLLSPREYEVFLDIAKGLKPNNIALKYEVKTKTISTYRKRILEKMCFNSNAEIIHYAVTNKLV